VFIPQIIFERSVIFLYETAHVHYAVGDTKWSHVAVTLRTCIQEVHVLNLGRVAGYPVFSGILQSLQSNVLYPMSDRDQFIDTE
jgi:hypothetical protein